MNDTSQLNPAEVAAEESLAAIRTCLNERKSFLLEAGAGAGKTYSLVYALKYLVEKHGQKFIRQHQKIACISYTNVASDEIKTRTGEHPAILSSTIHSFCWALIKDFQPFLRENLTTLARWPERIEEAGGILTQDVKYDFGYPKITEREVLLGHNDVLSLTVLLLEKSKFRKILAARFPIIFIDEYQDTNKDLANALQTHLFSMEQAPLIGLFGDHWQKIYGDGCGKIDDPSLEVIGKKANFRSVQTIVDVLNRIRPDLPQAAENPNSQGLAIVYHTNNYSGQRQNEAHWKDDLPSDVAHDYLENVKAQLEWGFSPEKTKILMLTHRVLAMEQGYSGIAKVFNRNEQFVQKLDPHIEFFIDVLEPMCMAYDKKQYGEMFTVLGERMPLIRSNTEKQQWADAMTELSEFRQSGTIGQVIDHLRQSQKPQLPDRVERLECELADEQAETNSSNLEYLKKLRSVPYREVIVLKQFLENHTPFSTKHGVKGAEFESVLVVLGGGWNQYNFNEMLELFSSDVPSNKQDKFERNRNLFYVACSRPRVNLALLFTQRLSPQALITLHNWFGAEAIHDIG